MTSATQHMFTGPGIHNRNHAHSLDVWENRPSKARGADPSVIVDPRGRPTDEPYSFLWSPHANVIALHPVGDQPVMGEPLALGDLVAVRIHGYVLGVFKVEAQSLSNPHLTPVETERVGR